MLPTSSVQENLVQAQSMQIHCLENIDINLMIPTRYCDSQKHKLVEIQYNTCPALQKNEILERKWISTLLKDRNDVRWPPFGKILSNIFSTLVVIAKHPLCIFAHLYMGNCMKFFSFFLLIFGTVTSIFYHRWILIFATPRLRSKYKKRITLRAQTRFFEFSRALRSKVVFSPKSELERTSEVSAAQNPQLDEKTNLGWVVLEMRLSRTRRLTSPLK